MRRVYLDHAATTPLDPEILEMMKPFFTETFGNASSVHQFGREARAALDGSRKKIAALIGAQSGELIFVSGGTEADNFALKGAAMSMRKRSGRDHIVTSRAEHHAVLEPCRLLEQQGFRVTYLDVDEYGMVHPERVERALTPSTGLISVMLANNEVGTINPVAAIGQLARKRGIAFHVDAVQAFGKLPLDVETLGVDLLSLSAHKIYGPKGIGALYIRRGTGIEGLIQGGGQERGRRAGTENVPLAVGFAEAAVKICASRTAEWVRLARLKGIFQRRLQEEVPFVLTNGHPTESLPHILNVSFDSAKVEIDGETLLFNLDLNGIAATNGSACTSGSIEASHVLLALGRDPDTAKATVRFSLGKGTTEEDIAYAADTVATIVSRAARVKHVSV